MYKDPPKSISELQFVNSRMGLAICTVIASTAPMHSARLADGSRRVDRLLAVRKTGQVHFLSDEKPQPLFAMSKFPRNSPPIGYAVRALSCGTA
jgi:hypothetical protein